MVPTGSTLLNMSISDNPNGAFKLGKLVSFVGDAGMGKTFLYLAMLAEASRKKRFKDYRLIHDDVESAREIDIEYLFGKNLANRLESPFDEGGSLTIQDFHASIFSLIEEGQPFIYGLDSFDALTSEEELERMKKVIKARGTGKKEKGSYQLETTKGLSAMLKQVVQGLEKTNSLLVIISQVRENISTLPFAPKYRYNGGRALKHNASQTIWLQTPAKNSKRRKTIGKKSYQVGVTCKARPTKNRLTGKLRDVEFPIYYDYGIDDIESTVDYLLEVGAWAKKGQKISTKGFTTKELSKEKLMQYIENNEMEKKLKDTVAGVWGDIENKLKSDRKRRY